MTRRGVFGSSGPTFCIFDAICSAVIPFRNMPQSAADSARTSAPAASSARVCGAGAGERKVSRRASEAALAGCARCAGVQSAECSHLGDAAALGAVHQRVPAPQVLADRDARHSLHRRNLCQYEGGRDGMRSASSRGAPAAGRWRRSRARAWSGGRSPPRARPPSSRAGAAWAVPTPAGCPVSSQLRRVFRKSWLPIDRPQRAQVPPVVGRPVPFLYPMVASFLSSIVVVKNVNLLPLGRWRNNRYYSSPST